LALNFGNSISAIRVAKVIDGLQITTGRLGTFAQVGQREPPSVFPSPAPSIRS